MTWVHLPNLTSSLAMEASRLVLDSPAWKSKPSATLRKTNIASKSSVKESEKDTWTTLPFGTTSQPSTGDLGVDTWILLRAVSRANHTVTLASVLERKIRATFGQRPFGLYGTWHPATSSWKMSEDWLTGLTRTQRKSLGIFPRQGTMQSGVCTALPTRVRPTSVGGGGVLPTPQAFDAVVPTNLSQEAIEKQLRRPHYAGQTPGTGSRRNTTGSLAKDIAFGMVKTGMWPTPKGSPDHYGRPRENDRGDLQAAVMWPTPASQGVGGPYGLAGGSGNRLKLYRMLGEEEGKKLGSGSLNPRWVEWLMGLPLGWVSLEPLAMESYQQWFESF